MDKSDLIIISYLLLFAGVAFTAGVVVESQIQRIKYDHICIELEAYCPDYSDLHHPCEKIKCTISDDSLITTERYSLYANRSQTSMKFSTELPDNEKVDGVYLDGELFFPMTHQNIEQYLYFKNQSEKEELRQKAGEII
jgi:hypothetical protein